MTASAAMGEPCTGTQASGLGSLRGLNGSAPLPLHAGQHQAAGGRCRGRAGPLTPTLASQTTPPGACTCHKPPQHALCGAQHLADTARNLSQKQPARVRRSHLVNTDLSCLRLTSVYRALAMVASGVRPWHLMSACSNAILHFNGPQAELHCSANLHGTISCSCAGRAEGEAVLIAAARCSSDARRSTQNQRI